MKFRNKDKRTGKQVIAQALDRLFGRKRKRCSNTIGGGGGGN